MFTHLSRGEKLMTTSLSHLKTQRIDSITWIQTEAHNQKWYFQEDHDTEKLKLKLKLSMINGKVLDLMIL
jgi:hypothetical protein